MRDAIYPRVDASELMGALNPVRAGAAYRLNCPACQGTRRAFYYPGASHVVCNRRDNCGARLSVWDTLESLGLSPAEIARDLHELAGVALPDDNDDRPDRQSRSTAAIIRDILGGLLISDTPAWRYLTLTRRYDDADIDTSILGFYPSARVVGAKLEAAGADLALCREWDVLPRRGSSSRFDNRLVGYWQQPDGTVRLWGRSIDGTDPKYTFAVGTRKARPYGWERGIGPTACVEGHLDQYALRLMGIPAAATGQNQVTSDQAVCFAQAGVREVLFLADAGGAGYEGILRTIAACESLGIVTSFSVTREGEDDVDALRAGGCVDTVHDMALEAVNGGIFVAQQIISLTDEFSAVNTDRISRLYRLRSKLTDVSRTLHDRLLSSCGVEPVADEEALMRVASAMSRCGMSIDAIRHQLRVRYGMTISFTAHDGR